MMLDVPKGGHVWIHSHHNLHPFFSKLNRIWIDPSPN
jgi:hypothetical protein